MVGATELVYDAGTRTQSVGPKHPYECVDCHALLHGVCGGMCVDEIVYDGGGIRFPVDLAAVDEVCFLRRARGAVVRRGWIRWVSTYLEHGMRSTLPPVEHAQLRQLAA